MTDLRRQNVQSRQRFDERKLPGWRICCTQLLVNGLAGVGGRSFERRHIAHTHGFAPTGGRQYLSSREFVRVVEHDSRTSSDSAANPLHAGAQSQFAPQFLELADELLEDQPDARRRPAQPFQENAAKHDAELPEIHVVRAGAAVKQNRAEEHFDQQRIA